MGFFDKIKQGLPKTKTKMDAQLPGIFAAYEPGDEEFFEDLEETLILADPGVETTTQAIAPLRTAIELKQLRTGAEVKKEFVQILTRILKEQDTMLLLTTQPSVVLVVGVNGVGKTTTKEFCYAVLSAFGKTLKTEGNQNNDIGVPNTLFRLTDDTEYAVVEMGMDHAGEIERLTRCARPSAGISTMIGVSHLENLGTRENILKAKMEICTGLPDGAPLALNADNDLLPTASIPSRLRPVWFGIDAANADVRAVDVVTGANGTTFKIVDTQYGTFDAAIPTAGIHTVYDALAAYAAATRLGLDAARCAAALATYRTTGMRQHIVEKGGITFIEDCYNASPDSMKAALSVLKALPNARKIALLGDMLELGGASEEGHRHTGEWAADAGVDALFAYGPRSAAMAEVAKARGVAAVHCQTAEEVLQYVRQFVRPGDAVLVKASHSMGLEQLLQDFYKELPQV